MRKGIWCHSRGMVIDMGASALQTIAGGPRGGKHTLTAILNDEFIPIIGPVRPLEFSGEADTIVLYEYSRDVSTAMVAGAKTTSETAGRWRQQIHLKRVDQSAVRHFRVKEGKDKTTYLPRYRDRTTREWP